MNERSVQQPLAYGMLYLQTSELPLYSHFFKTQDLSFLKTSMLILLYFIIPFLVHIVYISCIV